MPRLYKYHNTPLYFWLKPEYAEAYNEYYELLTKGPTFIPYDILDKAASVELKVARNVQSAYERGVIPDTIKVDRKQPLIQVY